MGFAQHSRICMSGGSVISLDIPWAASVKLKSSALKTDNREKLVVFFLLLFSMVWLLPATSLKMCLGRKPGVQRKVLLK